MKSILIVDITGRTVNYGSALYEALENKKQDECIHYVYPGRGLLKLIPSKYSSSENIIKRILKVVEGLLNYCALIFRIKFRKYDVIHFQWFNRTSHSTLHHWGLYSICLVTNGHGCSLETQNW